MAVEARGGSVLSPAEEHWRSMTPGQLQSLILRQTQTHDLFLYPSALSITYLYHSHPSFSASKQVHLI